MIRKRTCSMDGWEPSGHLSKARVWPSSNMYQDGHSSFAQNSSKCHTNSREQNDRVKMELTHCAKYTPTPQAAGRQDDDQEETHTGQAWPLTACYKVRPGGTRAGGQQPKARPAGRHCWAGPVCSLSGGGSTAVGPAALLFPGTFLCAPCSPVKALTLRVTAAALGGQSPASQTGLGARQRNRSQPHTCAGLPEGHRGRDAHRLLPQSRTGICSHSTPTRFD